MLFINSQKKAAIKNLNTTIVNFLYSCVAVYNAGQ